jgi:hypothetical protein
MQRLLNFLEHSKHTRWCINAVWVPANGVHAFPKDQQTLHVCNIVTAVLKWQYLQMELLLWIRLIVLPKSSYFNNNTHTEPLPQHCGEVLITRRVMLAEHVLQVGSQRLDRWKDRGQMKGRLWSSRLGAECGANNITSENNVPQSGQLARVDIYTWAFVNTRQSTTHLAMIFNEKWCEADSNVR